MMKLPDVNIWLALTLSGHSHHSAAMKWMEEENTPDSIYFCRSTQQSLLRLLTTEAVLAPYGIAPLSNLAAWDLFRQYFTDDRIGFAREPEGVEEQWRLLAARDTTSPKLWMDAWLAAFALASGLQFVTLDKGFKGFDNLDAHILALN